MEKSIVVIGEATRDQLQSARLRLLEQGHNPKVRRTTFDVFYVDREALFAKHASKAEQATYAKDPAGDYDELTDRLVVSHLEPFGPIGAIVLPEVKWRQVSEATYTWVSGVLDRQFDGLTYWVVYPDGHVELA